MMMREHPFSEIRGTLSRVFLKAAVELRKRAESDVQRDLTHAHVAAGEPTLGLKDALAVVKFRQGRARGGFENGAKMVGTHARTEVGLFDALLNTRRFRQTESASETQALTLLEAVGLQKQANVAAKNLAYGDQRKLEVARALASQPKLLLLDEPAAGMNPAETEQMIELIKSIRDKFGVTVVLIEHDMRVVMGISEKIAVLDHGEKIAEGTPLEIRSNPRVIEAYLGRGAATGA